MIDAFDIPRGVTFLNCANMSPPLKAVTEAGERSLRQRQAPWEIRSVDWFSGAEELRGLAASLLNASADDVALVPAVSYGVAIAAANLPIRQGQNIVILHEQFPSNVYAWQTLARERSAHIRTVRRPDGDAWTDAVLEAIDSDTSIVAIPNCHWTDGSFVDLVLVGAAVREVGAALFVDASQSFCAYPLDVQRVQPDFVVSVGYKWQLGAYGLGYLYVSPKWQATARPLEESWLSRAGAEDFSGLVNYTDALRRGARRFDMGEYPQFGLTPMSIAALTQVSRWGVDTIQREIASLTELAEQHALELGCDVLPRRHRVGHMIGVRFPAGVPDGLQERLRTANIHLSVRGDAIRIAPHVFSDEADIERLFGAIRASL